MGIVKKSSILFLLLLSIGSFTTQADAQASAGTNTDIVFVEGDPPKKNKPIKGKPITLPNTLKKLEQKYLPYTGEQLFYFGTVVGGILLAVIILFYAKKNK
ncbi:LPXTG cell wall anchor domain-containing protein [Enterococcus crotali]|uniref:LPXTG cell wall anchor domain-containing protein n=1 Tax=Enterococcus crotali TaxID=1453587 RepID=UPI0004700E6B|nr:LPXTG cell wall anchor domain-containing protein [Enterococcus crotali]